MSEYECENKKQPIYKPHKPVAGVIGAAFSVVSIMVANILRLFKVTKFSSVFISDKKNQATKPFFNISTYALAYGKMMINIFH